MTDNVNHPPHYNSSKAECPGCERKNNFIPRFRGNAFEKSGEWSWECILSDMGDNENGIVFSSNTLFQTKELAIEDMKLAIRKACDEIQQHFMGKITGEYIDMKTNETLKWDKEQHN